MLIPTIRSSVTARGDGKLLVAISAALLAGLLPVAGSPQAPAREKPIPRLADGHPDLSGIWENGAGIDFVQPQQRGESLCVSGCGPAPGAAPPSPRPAAQAAAPPRPTRPQYRPELQAKVADLTKRQVEEDPVLRCQAPGIPRIGPPDKIVQRAGEAVFLYDDVSGGFFRIVPTDGRAHRKDVEPSFLGESVAHWEGDTLVVESQSFNDKTWLTDDGAFHSTDLRVVERLKRTADTLDWTATVYDSKVLTEPWEVPLRTAHLTDLDLVEAAPCVDQDIDHIVDGSHHPNPR
ncbi:MAG TPA: hypothetical protein VE907_20070 [Gammaproteobacteria bacterium]|nr:hypothetical protein [Gammaproteobacteria bacterium]